MDPAAPFPVTPPTYAWHPRPKFQDRVWLHVLLFVLTIATTTAAGVVHYVSFIATGLPAGSALPNFNASLIWHGLPYTITILAILGCHEFGHYLTCRYYDVDASLPFFLPVPITLTGTLGAFIRIREPIPSKRTLFDIGIAGPLAGFAVVVPALFIGIAMSRVIQIPPNTPGTLLGEPLIFRLASWVFWGSPPDGYALVMHPMAFAAWFGLLATALNLFPIGQLDGGHIAYALLGGRSTYLNYAMIAVAVGIAYFSPSMVIWTALTIAMLLLFGPRHPKVQDEAVPLDSGRVALAVLALAIFIVCFTPTPMQPVDLLRP